MIIISKLSLIKIKATASLSSLSKAVKLTDVVSKEEIIFKSLGKCVEFFKSKSIPSSTVTLVKYLNTNISYRGYFCKSFTLSKVKEED